MKKKVARLRRAKRARMKIKELHMPRLCVYRSPRHIYAQIFSEDGARVVVSASTVEKSFKEKQAKTSNIEAASAVGKVIAERCKEAGITEVAFDRSGYRYHGRVKALADAARESGLIF